MSCMPQPPAVATALSWPQLEALAAAETDRVEGPTNAQATLRLFGQPPECVEVTLIEITTPGALLPEGMALAGVQADSYRIRKVTMRCYGSKEPWFLERVPSGMLPALELEGRLITESDDILAALEARFGPLGLPMNSPEARCLRHWSDCCFRPGACGCAGQAWGQGPIDGRAISSTRSRNGSNGSCSTGRVPGWMGRHRAGSGNGGSGVRPLCRTDECITRLLQGYDLRREHPAINAWFLALEQLETYRGTQSDFHTHAHDLPPQMGGCWTNASEEAKALARRINSGEGLGDNEASWGDAEPDLHSRIALQRVLRHRRRLLALNPLTSDRFDQPLRCALTRLVASGQPRPERAAPWGCVICATGFPFRGYAATGRTPLRQALEATAALDGPEQPQRLPVRNRFDQDPTPFAMPS